MIMPRGQQLLLPANPWFIFMSLLFAQLFNMVLNMLVLGNAAWTPDFLALVLVFWCVHQPQRVGIGVAFLFGLFNDVQQSSLLGQHALSYTVLAYCAVLIHRRLLWFKEPSQSLQVLPLFVLAHLLELMVRMFSGSLFPGWWMLLAPVIEALSWPVVSVLLLAPQRRAPDPDDHRPL